MGMRKSRRGWESIEQLESRQVLAAISWDGGGGDFHWSNPLNWSGDVLPGPADDVTINVAGDPVILHDTNTADSINSLASEEKIHLSLGSLTVAHDWKQNGDMTMSGGRIDGAGDILMGSTFSWTAGTIAGGGKFQVVTGHTTGIAGNVTLERNLVNNGTLTWDSGDIVTGTGVTITNKPGQTMVLKSGGMISGGATLVNQGTLIRDGIPNTTSTVAIGLDNQPGNIAQGIAPGAVVAHRGILSFTGTVVQKDGDTLRGGKWVVSSSDGKLLLPGADIAHVVGVPGAMLPRVTLIGANAAFPQIEGAHDIGVLTLAGGRQFTFANLQELTLLTLFGGMTVPHSLHTDQLSVQTGDTTFAQGVSARVVYVGNSITLLLNGTSEFANANVFGPGLLRIGGTLNFRSGFITGPGLTLVNASGRLLMDESAGAGNRQLTRRTINYGTIELNDGVHSFSFANEIVNRGVFNIRATDGFLGTPATAPAGIRNFGTINVSDDVTLRAAGGSVNMNNVGTIHVTDGTFILNGGVSGGGTWITDAGAETAFGGKDAVLTGAAFSGGGRVRVANHSTWTDTTMSGAGDMIVTVPGSLDVNGTATVIGRSAVTNNGRITLAPGAQARIESGLTNNGVLDLDTGALTVTGDLTMLANSDLRTRTTGASSIGTLDVGGVATMDGSLTANFQWLPPMGAHLDFFSAGSHSGAFDLVKANGLPAGQKVTFQFTGNMGGLTVTSA